MIYCPECGGDMQYMIGTKLLRYLLELDQLSILAE